MGTTIQISDDLLGTLQVMKVHEKESYESLIWDLVEDRMEFSPETLKNIEISKKEISAGKTVSFDEIKARLKK
jgi:predicted CopG family antitoxin